MAISYDCLLALLLLNENGRFFNKYFISMFRCSAPCYFYSILISTNISLLCSCYSVAKFLFFYFFYNPCHLCSIFYKWNVDNAGFQPRFGKDFFYLCKSALSVSSAFYCQLSLHFPMYANTHHIAPITNNFIVQDVNHLSV